MSSNPIISVITPVFNAEKVLPFAIDSVLAQTCKDIELILVDDCSIDGSSEIADHYVALDSRVSVIKTAQNSRSANIEWEPRNDGLRVSRGEYIAYLDADNFWDPRFLEKLLAPMKSDKSLKLAFCDSVNYYSSQDMELALSNNKRVPTEYGTDWTVFSQSDFDPGMLGNGLYIDTNEFLHTRDVFDNLNFLWGTRHPDRSRINRNQAPIREYRRHNDLDLVERIVSCFGSQSVHYVKEKLTHYFYSGAERERSFIPSETSYSKSRLFTSKSWKSSEVRLDQMNAQHFYSDYLNKKESVKIDFGLGEVRHIIEDQLRTSFKEYSSNEDFVDVLFRYGGTTELTNHFEIINSYYEGYIGLTNLGPSSLIPFDGCHNALFTLISLIGHNTDSENSRHVVYQIPNYAIWSTVAAANVKGIGIEAGTTSEFLEKVRCLDLSRVSLLIVVLPSNPFGCVFTTAEAEEITFLSRKYGFVIAVDLSYALFIPETKRVELCLSLPEEATVFCDTVSKSWSMPGLRLGYGITKNIKLATQLRAHKSSQSLLPSAFKQGFLSHLIKTTRYTEVIAEEIAKRRKLLINCLSTSDLGDHFRLSKSTEKKYGPFVTIDGTGVFETNEAVENLVNNLRSKEGIKVSPSSMFYPPSSSAKLRPFLRLSIAGVSSPDTGIEAFSSYLCNAEIKCG